MKTNQTNIHDGHRERIRSRYLEQGAEGLLDHELLELLLSYSIARKDTNPLAHTLIDRFGDLRGVLNAEPAELLSVSGIGKTSACLLRLISGLTQRYYEQLGNGTDRLDTPQAQANFFVPRFIGRNRESLFAAFLDANDRLLRCELQYEGSINAVEIHHSRIANSALLCGASKVVIAHNHFTETSPSAADIEATNLLRNHLQVLGIILVDHIIVCGANAVSIKESGLYHPPLQPH